VLRHYLCLAIVEKGGRVTPDDYAKIWLEKLNPDRLWANEKIVHQKLRIGMNPWDTGKGQPPAGCASMAIAPIGIINAGNPDQAFQDGFNIAFVNQDDVNRDGAATLAAGVAEAFSPGATVDSILQVMSAHCTYIIRRAIILTMDLAYGSKTVDEFTEKYYDKMLDWTWPSRGWKKDHFFSGSSIEIVPIVMAILYLCQGDVNQCLIEGASFGRDCDTISSIVGSIAGTLHGAGAIRQEWIDDSEAANAGFFDEVAGDPQRNFRAMAYQLVEALKEEQKKTPLRFETLSKILGT
jgi:ADP-ribosylglycohydrolase